MITYRCKSIIQPPFSSLSLQEALLVITVDGETATLTADVTLDAKVYGSSGSWTLPVNVKLRKIADKWYLGDK